MARAFVTVLIVLAVFAAIGAGVYFTAGDNGTPTPTSPTNNPGPADTPTHAITVQDDSGKAFTFEQPPKRIAALSAFAVEILMAMDVTPVARFEDPQLYPPAAEPIPTVGRSHQTGPDIEQLIAADPDLILLHWVYRGFAEDVAKQVSCTVMVLNITDLDQVRAKFELLGQIVGKADAAEALIADLDRTRDWLADCQPAGDRPRALSLLGQEDAWYAHRDNHFVGSLLAVAKADNIAGQDEAHSRYRSLAPIDLEQVIAKDPEVIFIMPYGDANEQVVLGNFNNHPATQSLAAVRNGRVHMLPYTISSQPGPRSGEALRNLFALLYPGQPGPPAE